MFHNAAACRLLDEHLAAIDDVEAGSGVGDAAASEVEDGFGRGDGGRWSDDGGYGGDVGVHAAVGFDGEEAVDFHVVAVGGGHVGAVALLPCYATFVEAPLDVGGHEVVFGIVNAGDYGVGVFIDGVFYPPTAEGVVASVDGEVDGAVVEPSHNVGRGLHPLFALRKAAIKVVGVEFLGDVFAVVLLGHVGKVALHIGVGAVEGRVTVEGVGGHGVWHPHEKPLKHIVGAPGIVVERLRQHIHYGRGVAFALGGESNAQGVGVAGSFAVVVEPPLNHAGGGAGPAQLFVGAGVAISGEVLNFVNVDESAVEAYAGREHIAGIAGAEARLGRFRHGRYRYKKCPHS